MIPSILYYTRDGGKVESLLRVTTYATGKSLTDMAVAHVTDVTGKIMFSEEASLGGWLSLPRVSYIYLVTNVTALQPYQS